MARINAFIFLKAFEILICNNTWDCTCVFETKKGNHKRKNLKLRSIQPYLSACQPKLHGPIVLAETFSLLWSHSRQFC